MGSGVEWVLHAVALALDKDGLGMMEGTVEQGRSERTVVIADLFIFPKKQTHFLDNVPMA
jgi:hypothetical protein